MIPQVREEHRRFLVSGIVGSVATLNEALALAAWATGKPPGTQTSVEVAVDEWREIRQVVVPPQAPRATTARERRVLRRMNGSGRRDVEEA
jgi:hypothetical protein